MIEGADKRISKYLKREELSELDDESLVAAIAQFTELASRFREDLNNYSAAITNPHSGDTPNNSISRSSIDAVEADNLLEQWADEDLTKSNMLDGLSQIMEWNAHTRSRIDSLNSSPAGISGQSRKDELNELGRLLKKVETQEYYRIARLRFEHALLRVATDGSLNRKEIKATLNILQAFRNGETQDVFNPLIQPARSADVDEGKLLAGIKSHITSTLSAAEVSSSEYQNADDADLINAVVERSLIGRALDAHHKKDIEHFQSIITMLVELRTEQSSTLSVTPEEMDSVNADNDSVEEAPEIERREVRRSRVVSAIIQSCFLKIAIDTPDETERDAVLEKLQQFRDSDKPKEFEHYRDTANDILSDRDSLVVLIKKELSEEKDNQSSEQISQQIDLKKPEKELSKEYQDLEEMINHSRFAVLADEIVATQERIHKLKEERNRRDVSVIVEGALLKVAIEAQNSIEREITLHILQEIRDGTHQGKFQSYFTAAEDPLKSRQDVAAEIKRDIKNQLGALADRSSSPESALKKEKIANLIIEYTLLKEIAKRFEFGQLEQRSFAQNLLADFKQGRRKQEFDKMREKIYEAGELGFFAGLKSQLSKTKDVIGERVDYEFLPLMKAPVTNAPMAGLRRKASKAALSVLSSFGADLDVQLLTHHELCGRKFTGEVTKIEGDPEDKPVIYIAQITPSTEKPLLHKLDLSKVKTDTVFVQGQIYSFELPKELSKMDEQYLDASCDVKTGDYAKTFKELSGKIVKVAEGHLDFEKNTIWIELAGAAANVPHLVKLLPNEHGLKEIKLNKQIKLTIGDNGIFIDKPIKPSTGQHPSL